MRGLDFIVGGIPRSGTTAFADALNRHPDLFCYASETGLLPLAQKMSANGPILQEKVLQVRDWLADELRVNLIDMVNFQVESGNKKPPVHFGRSDIDQLVAEIVQCAGFENRRANLVEMASATLASKLRHRSGNDIVGEKTPDNVAALDAISNGPMFRTDLGRVFVVVRRPLAVIRSMRARVADEADHFASAFRGDAAQQAGYYLRHALACARLARRGAHLLRYEFFAGNARGVLPKVLSAIGVPTHSRIVDDIDRHIDYRSRKDDREQFSSAEQVVIDAITEPASTLLGYGRDPRSRSEEISLDVGYRVISGEFEDKFLERRAIVMLVARQEHRRANLRMWHCFPGTVADGSDEVRWTAEDVDGHRLGSASALGSGPLSLDLPITLDPARGMRCANGNVMYVAEVMCSHAFVPLIHPFRRRLVSPDRREISGKLVSVTFD